MQFFWITQVYWNRSSASVFRMTFHVPEIISCWNLLSFFRKKFHSVSRRKITWWRVWPFPVFTHFGWNKCCVWDAEWCVAQIYISLLSDAETKAQCLWHDWWVVCPFVSSWESFSSERILSIRFLGTHSVHSHWWEISFSVQGSSGCFSLALGARSLPNVLRMFPDWTRDFVESSTTDSTGKLCWILKLLMC